MGGFKFPFQDKAVKFTCVNASAAEPPSLGSCFRRRPAEEKLWGMGSPEQPAWKDSLDPRQHVPNTLITRLVW